MANEFVARNGLTAQDTSRVTGSFLVTGGNVGIGTSTLSQRLVVGTSDSDAILINVGGKLYFRDTSTQIFEGSGLNLIAGSSRPIIFSADGSERMRIALGGNVGIGTTSPAYKLDVSGSVRVLSGILISPLPSSLYATDGTLSNYQTTNGVYLTGNTNGWLRLNGDGNQFTSIDLTGTGYSDPNVITFKTNNSERARISSTGNVGIGTAAPSSKLQVFVTESASGAGGFTVVGNTNSKVVALGANSTYSFIQSHGSVPLYINELGNNLILNANAGSVGIGTTTPANKLDVWGTFRVTGSATTLATFESSGAATYIGLRDSSGDYVYLGNDDGDFLIQTPTSAYSTKLIVKDDGNVGIGTTSPGAKLDVNGSAYFGASDQVQIIGADNGGLTYLAADGTSLVIRTSLYNNPIVFQINSVERVRISSSGSVGIGTNSPSFSLDVSGSGRFTNGLQVTGSFAATAMTASSLLVNGTITAQTLVVSTISSSVVYSSGSNIFGNSLTNVQQFTGSLRVTGSGDHWIMGGNVGINTATAAHRLDINGTTRFNVGLNTMIVRSDDYNNASIFTGDASSNQSYGLNLQVGSLGSLNNSKGSSINMYGNAQDLSGFAGGIIFNTSTDSTITSANGNAIVFRTVGLDRMRINSSGSVGVGTTTPSYRLSVKSASTSSYAIGITNTLNNLIAGVYETSGYAGQIYLFTNAGAQNVKLSTVDDSYFNGGNVGIGTTSVSYKLHVKSGASNTYFSYFAPSAGSGFLAFYQDTNNHLSLYGANASGTTNVVINTNGVSYLKGGNVIIGGSADNGNLFQVQGTGFFSGNVGIGTTTPTGSLQVSGSSNTVNFKGSGSSIFSVDGTAGRLFQVDDSLSGSLFSVNTAAGLPVIEAFSDNTVRIGQFGQRALFVSQSRVGIGLENPTNNLHVSGTTGGVFEVDGANAVNALYVSSSGNVGIGTTTVESIANTTTLTINGSTGGGATSYQVGGVRVGLANGNDNYFTLQSYNSRPLSLGYNGTNTLIINTSNNVGIGTTAPKQKLEVAGAGGKIAITNTGTTNYAELLFYEGSTTKADIWVNGSAQSDFAGVNSMNIWQGSNAPMAFYTNGTNERMRIDQNGNVGIGVTSPLAKLHTGINLSDYSSQTFTNTGAIITSIGVDHTAARTNVLSLMRDGTSGVVYAGLAAFDLSRWSADGVNARTQLDIRLANTDTATITDVLSLRSDGNVGIGITASAARLHVSGTSGGVFEVDGANAVNALYVSSSGNVGIGTTAPSSPLQVILPSNTLNHIFRSTVPENLLSIQTFPTTNRMQLLVGDYNGSASPNIAAISDTNTGIRWEGSDILKFVNNSSDSVTINATGCVGIGTTSPTKTLHVYTAANEGIFLQGTGGGVWMDMKSAGGSIHSIGAQNNGMGIYNRTTGSYRFFITDIGNVGIGSESPGAKLDVNGNVRATSFTGSFSGSAAAPGSNTQVIFNSSGSLAASSDFVFTGTSVGIGTTAPDGKLHVFSSTAGTITPDANSNLLVLEDGISNGMSILTPATSAGGISFGSPTDNRRGRIIYDHSADKMQLYTAGAGNVRMTIDNAGNVGIGTTAPGAKLEVAGTIVAGIYNNTRGQITSNGVFSEFYSTEANPRWSISRDLIAGGQAGIGFNDTSGTIAAAGSAIGGSINRTLAFYTSNGTALTERMRINASGNVAINTTVANYKFQVNTAISSSQTYGISIQQGTNGANKDAAAFGIAVQNSGESTNAADLLFATATGGSLSERMRITSGGSVGIGSTAPGTTLDVVGNVRATSFTGSFSGSSAAPGTNTQVIFNSSGSLAASSGFVFTGANVGIGTTNPTSRLYITADNSTTASIAINAGSTAVSTINFLDLIGTAGADQFIFNHYRGSTLQNYLKCDFGRLVFYTVPTAAYLGATAFNFITENTVTGNLFSIGNSTTRMVVSASGFVGIGTTIPSSSLHVHSATGPELRLSAASNGIGGFRILKGDSGTVYLNNQDNFDIHFQIAGSTKMILNSAGNVGIGTTSPSYPFVVSNNGASGFEISTTGGINSGPFIQAYNRSTSAYMHLTSYASAHTWYIGGTRSMDLISTGNLGIGTSAPSAYLDVRGASDTAGTISLQLRSGNTSTNFNSNQITFGYANLDQYRHAIKTRHNAGAVSLNAIDFYVYNGVTDLVGTIGTQHVMSLNGGSVGVGIVNPSTKLHVSSSTGGIFELDGASGSDVMYVSSSGNVGIGTTTPAVTLQVNATSGGIVRVTRTSVGSGYIQLESDGTNGSLTTNNTLYVNTGGSTRMTVLSGGNVGIGTTTPTVRLEVSGGSDLSTAAFVHSGLNGGLNVINNSTLAANRDSQLRLVNGTTYFGANDRTYQIVNAGTSATAADLFIQYWNGSSYAERMRITSAGNVGIGTTTPGARLDISGTFRNAQSTNALANGFTAAFASGSRVIDPTQPKFELWHDGTSVGQFNYSSGTLIYGTHTGGGTASNLFTILSNGNVGIGSASPAYALDVNGTGRFTAVIETSTREKKDNIQPYSTDINKFKQLEPVSFTWKGADKQDVGLIAEDVDKLFPEFVSKTQDGEVTGINYGKLTIVLINILKEQQERIERLEEQINK